MPFLIYSIGPKINHNHHLQSVEFLERLGLEGPSSLTLLSTVGFDPLSFDFDFDLFDTFSPFILRVCNLPRSCLSMCILPSLEPKGLWETFLIFRGWNRATMTNKSTNCDRNNLHELQHPRNEQLQKQLSESHPFLYNLSTADQRLN